MSAQNPKIVVSAQTKSLLDSKKTHPEQTYEGVIVSALTKPATTTPIKTEAVAGASAGEAVTNNYAAVLGWVADTRKKLPKITPAIRKEAFENDSLLRGTILLFLKNIILSGYDIMTADNKKYAAMIKDQKRFLEGIGFMQALRDNFDNYAVDVGHMYLRKVDDGENVMRLQRIEPASTTEHADPWDDSIKAYHQRINVSTQFSSSRTAKTTYDSWFIPGGGKWIESEGIEDPGAKAAWDAFKTKYNIWETSNLRVDAAEKVIALHKVRQGEPAPIDTVIKNTWLKQLIMVNGPNFIFRVLTPFIHVENGILAETTLPDGSKTFISSVPCPASSLDPERAAAETAAYTAYTSALQTDVDNLRNCLMNGGAFSSGPGKKINVIESGRSISPQFIDTILNRLDEEIGQAIGFPVGLIKLSGAELGRVTILEITNTAWAGSRQDFERVGDQLLRERFEGMTWDYEITAKDGSTETGTFTFEETETQFKLQIANTKDAEKEARTRLVDMQTLVAAKSLGAGRSDIQALGAQMEWVGLLDLEKFDLAGQPAAQGWGQAMPAIQSSVLPEQKPIKAIQTDEEKLKEELMKAKLAALEGLKRRMK